MSEIKDTVKGKWNHRFSSEEPKVELYEKEDFIQELPLLKKTTETSWEPVKTGIGNFFQNIQNGVVDVQWEISKKTCEYSMEVLRKTQINDGLQVAVIVLLYFILISVFKLILWIVSFIGFLLFIILKPFRIYTFTKGVTEKEEIW